MNTRGRSYNLIISLMLAAGGMAARAEQPSARTAFHTGMEAFAASNYAAAADAFLQAVAAAPAEKLDPAAAYYNAGLAAYASGDIEQASTHFAAAAASPDLRLQSKAYYNRGNALFHLANPPPALAGSPAATNALEQGEAAIGQAIQMYENAIALDPKDEDAKANYELAILKQQQLQQQKQQQQQQDQQKQDQSKQDQQDQDPQKQDPQKQNQEEQKDQKPEQQPQSQQAEQQPQPEPSQPDDQQKQEEQIQEEKPSEEMTPEEAAMLLDASKAQEQSQRDRLHPFLGRPVPVEKDW